MESTKYGVYNEDQHRMLTSASGKSLYRGVTGAKDLKQSMAIQYDSHLTIVEVTEYEGE